MRPCPCQGFAKKSDRIYCNSGEVLASSGMLAIIENGVNNMHAVQINVPDTLQLDAQELAWQLAILLYNQEKASLGQAAEMVGVSKRAFMEMMGAHGGILFSYEPGEVESW